MGQLDLRSWIPMHIITTCTLFTKLEDQSRASNANSVGFTNSSSESNVGNGKDKVLGKQMVS
jgi:hypothetical protein